MNYQVPEATRVEKKIGVKKTLLTYLRSYLLRL